MATPAILGALALVFAGSACQQDDEAQPPRTTGALSGDVRADGSSTVAPFITTAAGIFQRENRGVQVVVGVSGTAGGFERFCAGETDISNASRPIASEEERACEAEGVEYAEFQVANDALTVIASGRNEWVDCLTTKQLKRIWRPGSNIDNWNQLDPRFPDVELRLFGPGVDSGTFEFFTERIVGGRGSSRSDYISTENDIIIVRGVARSAGGLGYVGYSYYAGNADTLKALRIDGGLGCVAPTIETVQNGSYAPLSRPLYVYVNTASLARPAVRNFVRFMLLDSDVPLIAVSVTLIPLTPQQVVRTQRAFRRAIS
jgi:phosphate transport system substrate-binding protein